MKRFVFIILAYFLVSNISQIHAETILLLLDQKTSTMSIVLQNREYRKGEFLPAQIEIDNVSIKEKTKLTQMLSHELYIGDKKIQLGSKDGQLSESYSYPIEPFTTKPNDLVKIKRDGQICGTFRVEITENELLKYLSFVESNRLTKISLNEKSDTSIIVDIKNDLDYPLENIYVEIGSKRITPQINDRKLLFKIAYDDIESDSSKVDVVCDIKGIQSLAGKRFTIFTINKKRTSEDSLSLECIFIIVFPVVIILFFLYYVCKKRKWKHAKKINDINGRVFRVLCSDSPKVGDEGDKSGKFETNRGYIYRFKKEHFWGKILLRSIWIRIKAKDGSFFIDNDKIINDGPKVLYILPNNEELFIGKNTRAESDGVYELENDYIFVIRNGIIDSVKLKLKDRRNQVLIVILQSDSPQIGDKVESGNSPRYEMTDGTVYEISKHKIVNISHKSNASKDIILFDKDGNSLTITPKNLLPTVGDSAAPNGEFKCVDGKTYIVKGGFLINILEKQEESIEEIRLALKQAQIKISELEKRPTLEAHAELARQLQNALQKIKDDEAKLTDVDKAIEAAAKTAREEEKRKVESQYRTKISTEYISIASYKSEKSNLEKLKEEALKAKKKAEDKVKIKEGEITTAMGKIETLEADKQSLSESIIRLKASVAKMKDAAQKKNVHYLIQIQETLSDISESFKLVYKDIDNSTIKEGLITPMVKGVSGLSAGILSWSEDFSVKVLGDSEAFFGSDYLILSESEVKEQLARKFISNIVKSDSFSKFVRLYQLSIVPFIRKQLIGAKMDVETLNKLYYKVFTLVTDFGYTIICPRLFEELHSDNKYQWFNSTNLFNIITLPESEKQRIKENGSETIIDVNQIGYESPWASRKATAVTPDF